MIRVVYKIKPEDFAHHQPLMIWRRALGVYASTRYSIHQEIKQTELWHYKPTAELISDYEGEVRYCVDHRWLRGYVSSGRLSPTVRLKDIEYDNYYEAMNRHRPNR